MTYPIDFFTTEALGHRESQKTFSQQETKSLGFLSGSVTLWFDLVEIYSLFRLIRLAAKAAPKPLSILTTVTPLAQELSMPSRAAIPPNAAP